MQVPPTFWAVVVAAASASFAQIAVLEIRTVKSENGTHLVGVIEVGGGATEALPVIAQPTHQIPKRV